jgi:hypothetical protein
LTPLVTYSSACSPKGGLLDWADAAADNRAVTAVFMARQLAR